LWCGGTRGSAEAFEGALPGRGPATSTGRAIVLTTSSLPCTSAAFAELSADVLRAGAGLRFRAHGASMQPLVRDGDVLLIRPVCPDAVRAGDIVLCSSRPDCIVVHRVIRVAAGPDGPRFTVQGDAVLHPDGTFSAAQIYGRVAAIERDGSQIVLDEPVMRMLGRAALLRSRLNVRWGWPFRIAGRLARRLPVLSRYLA
jgi:hypothetical protein